MTTTDTPSKVTLAERLRGHEQLVGLILKMPNPAVIEIAGHLGFDLVLIDTEHGAGETDELEHHLRAADSAGIDVVVRVGANDPLQVLRALDAGAQGIIVPHINTAADALAAVRSAHYPPVGTRGLATSTRAGRHSTATLQDHLDRARRETVLIVQIEDQKAVAHAGSIAATPQVDAVWLGPSDLSMSLGHPGQLDHPHVAAAIDSIVEGINRAEGAGLCVVVDSEEDVAAWRARGASLMLFVVTNLLTARLREMLNNVKPSDLSPLPSALIHN